MEITRPRNLLSLSLSLSLSLFCMESIFLSLATFFISYLLLPHLSFSGRLNPGFIYPNFTASNFQFINNAGAFLSSRNGTFTAAIVNPGAQQTHFYLSVLHVTSNTIIWSANRDSPISNSGKLTLTVNGITIVDQDGSFKWSTPQLEAPVAALQLTETGNLVLLDNSNRSLWDSFDFPTDTIVIGQRLDAGMFLSSSLSDVDFSTGDYRFSVTDRDGLLQWNGQTYWKLTMDPTVYTVSNSPVEYLELNRTGLYLFGRNGSVIVIQAVMSQSEFRIGKLDFGGHFSIRSFSGNSWKQELTGPVDDCRIPLFCGRVGLCTDAAGSGTSDCSCPAGFRAANQQNSRGCLPIDSSYSLPSACNSTSNGSDGQSNSYIRLAPGLDYFANIFYAPTTLNVSLSFCQELCSKNCSCLALFYANSSGSCYLLKDRLGSFISSGNGQVGYIKTENGSNLADDQTRNFPTIALVLLPSTGFFLLITVLVLGFLWWRKRRLPKTPVIKLGRPNPSSSGELDAFSIPGLPVRFDYKELQLATDYFKTQIGSGGFGEIYKGTLPDKTLVAVKKITNTGVQGKKELCTEIAIIGNVHHVNLVKLRGFCAYGPERLLVYEYMNHGSLDRTLFGNGPVLEWRERVEIALGTARGLAYLHSGCEHKIIHCDVKPENILLRDHFQVKISDFGLSKLLSPEQSSLFTTMRGTRGYLAPEWLTSSAISDKTDVYSYGMVLLEIVRGRKNCSSQTHSSSIENDDGGGGRGGSGGGLSQSSSALGPVYLPLIALEMHEQGRYLELADPRLEGRVTEEEVEKLVRVALCCVHEDPTLRPRMVDVVAMLEGGTPLGKPRVESLTFLRFYGRRFTEPSVMEGYSGANEFNLNPQGDATQTTNTSSSYISLSYIPSQQVSGPR